MRIVFFLFFSTSVFSYPQLSRYGYPNCTACHLSPAGGGLLTLYGRESTKEVLTTWGSKNEQYFLYNAFEGISKREDILLGGDIRGIQVLLDTKDYQDARTILMQADLAGAYNPKKWALAAAIGRIETGSGQDSEGHFLARSFYFLYRFDDKQNIRAGRFLRYYGLNEPNHNLYVRRDVGFGFDTETYNLEYTFLGDTWGFYFTPFFGNFENSYAQTQETGVTGSLSYFFWDKQQAGLSALVGKDDGSNRFIFGPWLKFSFIKNNLFLLSEFNYQEKKIEGDSTIQKGYVTSNSLNYEFPKGLITYILYENKDLNFGSPASHQQSYGLGFQFFPRPHWDLMGAWQRAEIFELNATSNLYWLILHFYF